MAKPEKEQAVRELVSLLGESQSAIVTDYRGLTVKQLTMLRRRLAEVGAVYHVSKNTLTRRALAEAGKPELGPVLEGPTAIAFTQGDPAETAKVLAQFARESRILALKGGLLGNAALSQAQVAELATLPSRDVMLSMLVGVVQAPIANLVGSLQSMLGGLVFTLQAIADQKGAAA